MEEVTILMPSRFDNRWPLDLALRTIRKYTRHPHRIIVGDAGIEGEAVGFLSRQEDVQVVRCPDPLRPKNHLARVAETPYMLFIHDDAQILRTGWLARRVHIMERSPRIGIVGRLGNNFERHWTWRRLIHWSAARRRFFPFGLLVRRETQRALNLYWGRIAGPTGFDNGGVAYLQFRKQRYWRYVSLNYKRDIRHWTGLTWVLRRAQTTRNEHVARLLRNREERIARIRQLLDSEDY